MKTDTLAINGGFKGDDSSGMAAIASVVMGLVRADDEIIAAAGLDMLAIYHSHPQTPARPSAEDIRLALTPDVIYVILSLQEAEAAAVKGFLIEDDNVTEVPVKIVEK